MYFIAQLANSALSRSTKAVKFIYFAPFYVIFCLFVFGLCVIFIQNNEKCELFSLFYCVLAF